MYKKKNVVKKVLALLLAAVLTVCAACADQATGTDAVPAAAEARHDIEIRPEGETTECSFLHKVDGDTAVFLTEEYGAIKVRFLGIDTPETVKDGSPVEEWGPEASEYTTARLKDASEIVLEWDAGSSLTDAYGRYLAWVWADGSLLNAELVREGLAKVAYIYGDYYHTDDLYALQKEARDEGVGLWSE